MGETTHQIEERILHTRENLGSNIRELERKVKSVTDWKQHVETRPLTMLGIAFGGGVLLASTLARPNRLRHRSTISSPPLNRNGEDGFEPQREKALETWGHIKGALIGVAASRFKEFIKGVVPGFDEQYALTEQNAVVKPGSSHDRDQFVADERSGAQKGSSRTSR